MEQKIKYICYMFRSRLLQAELLIKPSVVVNYSDISHYQLADDMLFCDIM